MSPTINRVSVRLSSQTESVSMKEDSAPEVQDAREVSARISR
jgi:hypothetical protein